MTRVWLQCVSSNLPHQTGAAPRARRTGRSSPCSWTKITTLYTWPSPAASCASPSAAVSATEPVKSKLVFSPCIPAPAVASSVLTEKIHVTACLVFLQVLHCLTGPVLWLVKPGRLWESDHRNAVSTLDHPTTFSEGIDTWKQKWFPDILLFVSFLFFSGMGKVLKKKT